ncbi:hypothetical protein QTO30_12335 [Yoonia sp. GPGPB17]|uniref:hypothetical protein n=1 Tax=Yoonia sp. GPGPB17 TaxID=3026147 RepID=UPI0030C3CEE2
MFKPLIAGITALSLTLATTTPLQAQGLDRDDVGKLIFGLAAIAVIGAAIDNNRDRDRNRRTQVHQTPQRNNSWSDLNRDHQNAQNRRRALPHACLRSVETRFGQQRLFGKRCLERNYRHVNRLPDRCAVRIYTTDGPRRGFDPVCLREQGFRSDRHY